MASRTSLLLGLFVVAATGCSSAPTDAPSTTPTEETSTEETATVEDTEAPSEETGEDTSAPPTDSGKPDTKTAVDTFVPPTDTPCTPTAWYRDEDGDGFGDATKTMNACTKPSGYVADKTDCDDKRNDVKPGAAELCDGVDNDCNGTIDGTATEAAACAAAAGKYAGTYEIYTAEKLGSTIVNQMKCTGTSAITIDLKTSPVLKGTVTCTYVGGLTAFGKTQTGTIEATLKPNGTIDGKLTHGFSSSSSDSRTFTFTGTATAGKVDVAGKGSWKPNPMSAVPWEVTFSFVANKT